MHAGTQVKADPGMLWQKCPQSPTQPGGDGELHKHKAKTEMNLCEFELAKVHRI